MKLKYLLLQALTYITTLAATAGTSVQKLPFSQYSTADGLVSNRIHAIQQDGNGFLWLATDFGLERFDGQNFKLLDQKGYPNLWKNDIIFLHFHHQSTLTLGGSNGFVMDYDIRRDTFTDIMPPEQQDLGYQQMKGSYTNAKGERFLYSNCGFYKQDAATGVFHSLFNPLPQLKSGIIDNVYQDNRGRFWLTSVNELAVFSSTGQPLARFETGKQESGVRSNILPLNDGRIAISINSKELWRFDCTKDEIAQPEKFEMPFGCIYKILTDSHNRTWFATDGEGLWYTDHLFEKDCPFVQVEPMGKDAAQINKIYGLVEDKNGGIWIGTQNAGLWHTTPYKKQNITYSGELGFPKVVCSGFAEDEAGNLFIATDGNGIYKMGKDGSFCHFSKSEGNYTHLCRTTNGELMGTTWGNGILIIDPATGKTSRPTTPHHTNASSNLFSITATTDGELWAAPGNDDLYFRDPSGNWHRLELGYDTLSHWPNKWHLRVVEGADGNKWVITTNTLWRIEKKTHSMKALIPDLAFVKSHNPLTLNDGDCDKNGDFFLATKSGILRYPANGGPADTLSYAPTSNTHAIRFDNNGFLWAACDNGIWQIDTEKRTSRIVPCNYTDLAKCYFFDRAGFVGSNGNIYFGTNGGFFRLDANAQNLPDSLGYFAFSGLTVAHQKVAANNATTRLDLKHGHTNISIGVDYVDFSELGNASIRYRLKGLSDEWLPLEDARTISYSYLPTGTYELQVEVVKQGIEEQKKAISLPIRVLPPWWLSWWFIILSFLAIAGLASYAMRKRISFLEAQRLELRKKVEEQTVELRKMVTGKDRLISIIAHDLKSPMFGIVGALENWLNKFGNKAEDCGQGSIEKTHSSAEMLQSTLLGLIDWAHSQDLEYRANEIDLPQLAHNAYKLQLSQCNNKDLKVTFGFNYTHRTIADERMLNTVVRNLLSNAIKFSFRGGAIAIDGWEEDDSTFFRITDHGTGLTPQQLEQLRTQHFCQSTDGTELEKGTGLGLSLCLDYVNRCKGDIDIECKAAGGTSITIQLPMGKQTLATTPASATAPATNIVSPELLQGNTILVVDDDELICQNMATLLQPYMQVVTASNGLAALEKMKACNIDIVLSDVEMPQMDGIELCKQLARENTHIPFLFVSARTEEDDRMTGLLSGAIDYIPKPFNSQELLLKLSNILLMRQMRQQALLEEKIGQPAGEEPAAKNSEPINPFVEKFLQLIEANYGNNQLSVDTLAKEMAVSQSTLGRKLKSLVGKTAVDILTEYRLNKARTLLKENKETMQIGDIAFRVGFSDPSYFSKKFKEFFGYSPSEEG